MQTAIWWIRRDLRLHDNQALTAAFKAAAQVLPVFILDPMLLHSSRTGEKRLFFLLAGLRALDADLQERGAGLILRRGDPLQVLPELLRASGAEAVFAEADHSTFAVARDQDVAKVVPLHLTGGVTVHAPGTVLNQDGKPYTVFTPFRRAWRSQPFPGSPLPAPERITMPAGIAGETLTDLSLEEDRAFPAGEAAAQQRLERFLQDGIASYAEQRNRMDLDGTSALSPYLRFGMLSARQAAWSARQAELQAVDAAARQGAETWLNELIWREFYIAILYHFPVVSRQAFREDLRSIRWRDREDEFQAWKEGRTGYPVVDAAMRQLLQTGWMHNRARMIVASFLTKDLLVDWRKGEAFFMEHLLDGDPAANNGGWQWTAGTGTGAAPYFRIFNPVLQGMRFDPHGEYVRRYVPELAHVPGKFIHEPWKMPREEQQRAACIIGSDYPAPIVDHALARQRTLLVYRERNLE